MQSFVETGEDRRWLEFLSRWSLLAGLVILSLMVTFLAVVGRGSPTDVARASDSPRCASRGIRRRVCVVESPPVGGVRVRASLPLVEVSGRSKIPKADT